MRRVLSVILTALLMLGVLVSCTDGDSELKVGYNTDVDKLASASVSEENEKTTRLYEAEDAIYEGLQRYSIAQDGGFIASVDGGYIGLWDSEESSLTFHVEVGSSGMYELVFLAASYKGESYNTVSVNGRIFFEGLHIKGEKTGNAVVKAKLNEGVNSVTVTASWGWFYIDRLIVCPAEGISPAVYQVSKELANKAASGNARRLMSYLVDQYGKFTLSGQYASDKGVGSPEVQAIYELTGKYPAIIGFDLMDYSPSRVEYGANSKQIDYALDWGHLGGIVTLIWHWNAPVGLIDSVEHPWWKGFYTESTTFDLNAALNGGDPDGYELILRDIDAIAEQLNRLSIEDIPVLWRPLHEASGGWFWWGAHGPENYKKLWLLMYERFTRVHHLNNLIWVYNGQDADWYPGDAYVDIIGEDVYTKPRDYESQYNRFEQALSYTGAPKIIGLSENGVIPDLDLMDADNARWSFFITWCDLYVVDKRTGMISYEYNERDHFIQAYHSAGIITLDELPLSIQDYPLD